MRAKWIFIAVGWFLLGLGSACQPQDKSGEIVATTAAPLPTQAAIVAISPTNTSPPTETPTPIVADIPESLPTETPNLTSTPLSTDTPQPIPTIVLTPPAGVIYFLWDPRPVQHVLGLTDPRPNFYRAEFLDSPDEWRLQPVIEEIVTAADTILSSDQTKVAFSIIEDSNGDGHASVQSNARGGDYNRVYIYDLRQGILTRAAFDPPNQDVYTHRWLSSDQSLALRAGDLFFWNTISQQAPGELIYPQGSPRYHWLSVSPDGEWVAVNIEDRLELLNTEIKEVTQVISREGLRYSYSGYYWSPDNHWLMLRQGGKTVGDLIDLTTNEAYEINLPDQTSFSEWIWSSDSRYLLLSTSKPATPSPLGSLYLFDPVTKEFEKIFETSASIVGNAAWTPDDSQIIFLMLENNAVSLMKFNLSTKELVKLWEHGELTYYPHFDNEQHLIEAWSPDNEWGIFKVFTGENQYFLGLLHLASNQIYPLIQDQKTLFPYSFFWISE